MVQACQCIRVAWRALYDSGLYVVWACWCVQDSLYEVIIMRAGNYNISEKRQRDLTMMGRTLGQRIKMVTGENTLYSDQEAYKANVFCSRTWLFSYLVVSETEIVHVNSSESPKESNYLTTVREC